MNDGILVKGMEVNVTASASCQNHDVEIGVACAELRESIYDRGCGMDPLDGDVEESEPEGVPGFP